MKVIQDRPERQVRKVMMVLRESQDLQEKQVLPDPQELLA